MSNNLDMLWYDFAFTNNSVVFEAALNWDATSAMLLADIPGLNFLTSSNFTANAIYLDYFTKLSFIDVFHMWTYNPKFEALSLLYAFYQDAYITFAANSIFLNLLFASDYQDLTIVILKYAPELVSALNEYQLYFWDTLAFNTSAAALNDVYTDSINNTVFEFFEYIILNSVFFFFCLLCLYALRVSVWTNSLDSYIPRYFFYLVGLAKDLRFQIDAFLWLFGFMILFSFFAIMTFDDDRDDNSEAISSFWFAIFLLIIAFLVYRYSYHYFSFLEISVSEGKAASFIAKQFFRDFVNTFALLLRFFILVFRLNVYDGLDDLYDSYYFFVGDFDEDEYFDECLFSVSSLLFYTSDNNDDRGLMLEDEHDWAFDFFYLIYLVWGKFFFFLFFLIEELMRIILALYIIYLIIFDVHAVNCSYREDSYFERKRSGKKKNIAHSSLLK